jgi:hypothetical protein
MSNLTFDARFVKAAASIDSAREQLAGVADPKAKAALESLTTGLHAILSLLAEREADANGWPRAEIANILNS